MIRNLKITERTERRLAKIEENYLPRFPAVAIVEPGEPIPEGVKVVIVDDIPKEPITIVGDEHD